MELMLKVMSRWSFRCQLSYSGAFFSEVTVKQLRHNGAFVGNEVTMKHNNKFIVSEVTMKQNGSIVNGTFVVNEVTVKHNGAFIVSEVTVKRNGAFGCQ